MPWGKYAGPKQTAGVSIETVKRRGKNDLLDIVGFIRDIQRSEGHSDCFRRAEGVCDRLDCAWSAYCLEKRLTESKAQKNDEETLVRGPRCGAEERTSKEKEGRVGAEKDR